MDCATIVVSPGPPPPPPRPARTELTLDDASVRSLALLDGDLVDDADLDTDGGQCAC